VSACHICSSDDQQRIEELGLEALKGLRSWRNAAIEAGVKYPNSLKAHMERHFVAHVERVAEENDDEYAVLIAESVRDLQTQMSIAPVDIKPLYAVAIANLKGLENTKPSQQHLIAALKAIHEITGMKAEQQLLLQYAGAFQNVIDVEVVEPDAIEA
jgi:ribosome-binding factor A